MEVNVKFNESIAGAYFSFRPHNPQHPELHVYKMPFDQAIGYVKRGQAYFCNSSGLPVEAPVENSMSKKPTTTRKRRKKADG